MNCILRERCGSAVAGDFTTNRNYSSGCKVMYRTLLEDVWLRDIGRMAEVRNVPHLAWCEQCVCSHRKSNVPHVACGRVAQRKCWLIDNYFKEYKHLKTAEPHVASNVRYISFQRNLQLKIHQSSNPKW